MLFAAKNVFAFPEITVQPLEISIASNLPAVFTVTALQLGSTKPMFAQWRRNGEIFSGGTVVTLPISVLGINVGVTSTLTIAKLQPSDCGAYSVVVYDGDGAVDSAVVNLSVANLLAVLANDLFTNRVALNPSGGSAGANNFNATNEIGEPKNLGVPGGSAVWFKWIAPSNGVARFGTGGSDFDTTIGIYVKSSDRYADSVTNLTFIAGDDDSKNYFNSTTTFTAASNTEYEIMVDGFYGAQGNIVLNWSMDQTNAQVPQILTQPQSITVGTNARVDLFVTASSGNAPLQYQWYFNGNPLAGQTQVDLLIPQVTAVNVGQYKVALSYSRSDSEVIFSQPAQVQIDFENNFDAEAQAKFHEVTNPDSGLTPNVVIHPMAAPVSGFSGTHIYNTYGAASEPGEPNHCGVVGGAPYWFSYLAPTNGSLTVSANTPAFTNVLAAYTWPGGDFSTLVPVACASTNAGVGNEVTSFPVVGGTNYYLVVDGRNGAVGQVTLSYNLTNSSLAPIITLQPQSQTVAQDSNTALSVKTAGAAPMFYQWRGNAAVLNGQTNISLTISNFQSGDQKNYDVIVTNTIGSATSSIAALYLNTPLQFIGAANSATNGFSAVLIGGANTNYVIQASSNLVEWISIETNSSPFGIISITDTNMGAYFRRFFRAQLQ